MAQPQAAKTEPPKHLIHFLDDGFTALETMWYRGQELEVVEGTPEWIATLVPTTDCRESLLKNKRHIEPKKDDGAQCECRSWLTLTAAEQMDKYNRTIFGEGLWPGKSYEDEKASKVEADRRRKVPRPVVF